MGRNPLPTLAGFSLFLAMPLPAQEFVPAGPFETTQEQGLLSGSEADSGLEPVSRQRNVVQRQIPSLDQNAGKQLGLPQNRSAGFQWKGALLQSGFFLGIQHGFRMFTTETRSELDGPFLKDYWASVCGLQGWGDGDSWTTNYVAHPIMGAIAGYVQVQNDPAGIRQEFGKNPAYWKSRFKAMGWAAIYSTQFELGPISEASLGNVGQKPGTMGFVDLVITPLGGFGLMIVEDVLDKYLIRKLEARTSSRNARGFYRIALNPARSFANFLRLHHTYHRDTR